ncbi:MAG: protein kinase family protein [Planctomycetes bacterium]|nr:protein kinase family protein [Planctomycetota bacterium]
MAHSGGTYWPSMSDYQEAVQTPSYCFMGKELQQGTTVTNKLGLPRPICGTFASVYELETAGGARWAVKCFLRNIPDLHNRYAKISDHLKKCDLPYFVTFEYQEKGIRVQGKYFPLVKMQWIEGMGLNQFVEKIVSDSGQLGELEKQWQKLLEDLRSADIGHGDLQHGNVLVQSDSSLRLIDYDGMWVPKLRGQKSHETGHPDFQSPLRSERDFDADIDQFAGDVIHIVFRALARKPSLWQQYNNGDNMLFRRQDFRDPKASSLFADLKALGDDVIGPKLDGLIKACGGKPKGGGLFKRAPTAKPPKEKATVAPPPVPAAPRPAGTAMPPPRTGSTPSHIPPTPLKAKRKIPAGLSPQAAPATPPRPAPVAKPPASVPAAGPSWLGAHFSGQSTSPVAAAPAAPALRPPVATPRAPAAVPPSPVTPPRPSPAPRTAAHHAAAGRSHGGALNVVRLMIHVLLVVPVTIVAIMQIVTVIAGEGDETTNVLMPAFAIAAVMGLASVGTLFRIRGAHATLSMMFLVFVSVIMLVNMVAELFNIGSYGWSGDDLAQCILMLLLLLLSGAGLLTERASQRG